MMIFSNFDYSMLIRLLVAVVLGGIIGLERGGSRHDAGLRTHIIVALGAALVMVLSESLVKQYNINSEIMRMGAQVISGIGFLGVGSIIIDRNRVRGITTAAGLWTTACIGLAVGSGYYIIAFASVLLVLFATLGLRSIAYNLRNREALITVKIEVETFEQIKEIFKKLKEEEIEMKTFGLEENKEKTEITMDLSLPKSVSNESLMSFLYELGKVKEFTEI